MSRSQGEVSDVASEWRNGFPDRCRTRECRGNGGGSCYPVADGGSCDTASIRTKPSSSGKYISVTATVQFTSKEQLEALYRALHARDEVTQTL